MLCEAGEGVNRMKIKEVEERVGIQKKNIRYYEEEGLLRPARNRGNNYREYSEEDVRQLERIKALRALGIPISDIRLLSEERASLDEIMKKRLDSIEGEARELQEAKKICESIISDHVTYDTVDSYVAGQEKDEALWRDAIIRILNEDITKERLTPAQFHFNVMAMLVWGYFLNAVLAVVFQAALRDWQGKGMYFEQSPMFLFLGDLVLPLSLEKTFYLFFIICGLSVAIYVVTWFCSSVKGLMLCFHICVLALTPVTMGILAAANGLWLSYLSTTGIKGQAVTVNFPVFWMLFMVYVVILWTLTKKRAHFFGRASGVVSVAVVFSAAAGAVLAGCGGKFLSSVLVTFVFAVFVGMNWFHMTRDNTEPNRYYAISQCCRMMNLVGVIFNMKGKTRSLLR